MGGTGLEPVTEAAKADERAAVRRLAPGQLVDEAEVQRVLHVGSRRRAEGHSAAGADPQRTS
jgi:hypothetical protein